jgi:predicted RNA binding protein with dsRBD fold (UPF0201 family)
LTDHLSGSGRTVKYHLKHGRPVMEIQLATRCFPTEDRDKVVASITKLFPDAIVTGEDPIVGLSHSIDQFADQLRKQRIRDAARAVLRRGTKGDETRFILNKQVASIGKVSFSEMHHPLGDIEVTIVSDEIEALIDSIAPDTRKGGVP